MTAAKAATSTKREQRPGVARGRPPGGGRLGRLLSLAMRSEPALVRAARLAAQLDASVESDFWFSGLVSNAGPLGVALHPAVAEQLRAELAADAHERELAWRLVQEHHGQAPW